MKRTLQVLRQKIKGYIPCNSIYSSFFQRIDEIFLQKVAEQAEESFCVKFTDEKCLNFFKNTRITKNLPKVACQKSSNPFWGFFRKQWCTLAGFSETIDTLKSEKNYFSYRKWGYSKTDPDLTKDSGPF